MDPNANVQERIALLEGDAILDTARLAELAQAYADWRAAGGFRADAELLQRLQLAEWTRKAREQGQAVAIAAAGWIIDGNTDQEHIRRMLGWLEDGDPRADEYLPARPNLSGEYSDEPTPRSLFEEVTGLDAHAEASWNVDAYSTVVEALCDAWEAGVDEAFADACETELRNALDA